MSNARDIADFGYRIRAFCTIVDNTIVSSKNISSASSYAAVGNYDNYAIVFENALTTNYTVLTQGYFHRAVSGGGHEGPIGIYIPNASAATTTTGFNIIYQSNSTPNTNYISFAVVQ